MSNYHTLIDQVGLLTIMIYSVHKLISDKHCTSSRSQSKFRWCLVQKQLHSRMPPVFLALHLLSMLSRKKTTWNLC